MRPRLTLLRSCQVAVLPSLVKIWILCRLMARIEQEYYIVDPT